MTVIHAYVQRNLQDMSFIQDFDAVFAEPEDVVADEQPVSVPEDDTSLDYFDRDDEPVIW